MSARRSLPQRPGFSLIEIMVALTLLVVVLVVAAVVATTATGTCRRNPDVLHRIGPRQIAEMAELQAALLARAARWLARGGTLVYATCSLEPEENEKQIEAFLASNPDWKLEPPPSGAVPHETMDSGYLRVLPQLHGSDGAFAARLRRSQ